MKSCEKGGITTFPPWKMLVVLPPIAFPPRAGRNVAPRGEDDQVHFGSDIVSKGNRDGMPRREHERQGTSGSQAAAGRRAMLCGVAALLAGATAAASPAGMRRLVLVRADNGERFDGPFRDAHGHDPGALGEFAHFMRDRHVARMAPVDPPLLDFLADVLGSVGATEAILLSGYRSPETEAKLAATRFAALERSPHVQGRAIDFTIGRRLQDAADAARAMRRGGVGWYPGSRFVHLDTGAPRHWTLAGDGLRGALGLRAARHRDLALEECRRDPARRAACGAQPARPPAR